MSDGTDGTEGAAAATMLDLADWAEAVVKAVEEAGWALLITEDDPERGPIIRFANRRAAEIRGQTLAGMIGSSALEGVRLTDQTALLARLVARRGGQTFPPHVETDLVRADGTTVPVESAFEIVQRDGKRYYVSFFRDLSERRASAERLALSEARFRKLIESAPDAVWVTQGQTLYYANPAFARLLGAGSPRELEGRRLFELMHPDDAKLVQQRIGEIERVGGPQPTVERRLRHASGEWVSLEITTIGIEYDDRPSILCYGRDLTQRRKLQAQLLQADRMAAVGAMAAGVAHEINNPLAYVMLNLDMVVRQLKGSGAPASLIEKLEEAREGADRVAVIVRDLLQFARSDDSWGPINLRDAVEGALRMVKAELRARATLEIQWADLPPVDGNSARLGQVFLNLLINALQAMPAPRPDQNLVVIRAFEDDGWACVEVLDNGTGIPEAALARIFEPFFTTKPAGEGTGLGLSICHSIVTGMGGRLTAANRPGGGACFRVCMPPRGSVLGPPR